MRYAIGVQFRIEETSDEQHKQVYRALRRMRVVREQRATYGTAEVTIEAPDLNTAALTIRRDIAEALGQELGEVAAVNCRPLDNPKKRRPRW